MGIWKCTRIYGEFTMRIDEKIDIYLNEEMKIRFWNMLIDLLNKKWGSKKHRELTMMLRQDKVSGNHSVSMVNTSHELPKALVDIVKKLSLGKDEIINEKNRRIVLTDENWKKVYKAAKQANESIVEGWMKHGNVREVL